MMSSSDNSQECRVALVTGSGYGIGRAVALRLAESGVVVVTSDINTVNGEETAHMICEAGGKASFCRADVAVELDVEALVEHCVREHGRLDWACNNAGIVGSLAPVVEHPVDDFDRVISINLRGVFLCLQYELRAMLGRGTGAIVNLCSETSIKAGVAGCGYTASKHAVHGLTKVAALEVAQTGVRVNAVAPGNIRTGIVEAAPPEMQKLGEQMMPSKRYGEPSEIAEAVYWLMSDAASLVNGHMLVADSGWAIS